LPLIVAEVLVAEIFKTVVTPALEMIVELLYCHLRSFFDEFPRISARLILGHRPVVV